MEMHDVHVGCPSNEVFGEWQAYDDDDLDPFEHWEQVQEQQRQRQLQQGPDTAASLLPL